MRPGLRAALLLAMLPVLLLPALGLWFVGQMAQITRDERRESLNVAALNYAAALSERADLLSDAAKALRLPADAQPLALEVLARADVDGRADEWVGVARHALQTVAEPDAPTSTLEVQLAVARSQEQPGQLFLLIEARDERFVPASVDPLTAQPSAGDEVQVLAGTLPDALLPVAAELHAVRNGWLAEVALPGRTRYVRVHARDIDYQASRKLEATASSALLALTSPSLATEQDERLRAAELEARWSNAIRGFERAGLRVSVHDTQGRLLARLGELLNESPPLRGWLHELAARLLALVVGLSSDFNAVDKNLSPLSAALTGVPSQQSLRVVERDGTPFWLTTSAQPIWFNDRVSGVLMLERGSGSDLARGESVLQWLALLAAAAIVFTSFALFSLMSLTVSRIVRLRKAADSAIDMRGRVVGSIPRFRWQDEVGSLASSYEGVLSRLREHQQYLANLRGRLVHELRTPIMVVRSSLENLTDHHKDNENNSVVDSGLAYVERALGGTVRLERIVASMSEAASLESMLADSQLERVDLAPLLRSLALAYESAWSQRARPPVFVVDANIEPAFAMVVPETIAQAVDKLVANAVDFATPGSRIHLELSQFRARVGDSRRSVDVGIGTGGYTIAVRNAGRPLPAEMSGSLFESMVSVRGSTASDQSHLGLGLYLVRLIAEFHGGHAFAENVDQGVRVGFTVDAGLEVSNHKGAK